LGAIDSSPARPRAVLSGPAITLVLLSPMLLRVVQSWLCRIGSRYLWDYGPGQFAWAVSRLANGGALYGDFRATPHLPIPYNPLAFYLAALLSKPFGASVMSALEAGRVETIAATITSSVLTYMIARRDTAGRGCALIAAFAFAISHLLEPWGFAFRCDMPALACDLAGLYLFMAGFEAWSIVAFVAAFFTRQTEIAGVAAVCLFCLVNGRGRAAAVLGLAWAAAIASGMLLLHLLLPNYLLNAVLALSPIYDWRAPLEFLARAVRGDPAIAILAATALATRGARFGLAAIFLLTALAQAMGTSARWGSDVSYFIPALAAASVLAADGLEIVFAWARRNSRRTEIWTGIAVAFAIAVSVRGGKIGFASIAHGNLGCGYLRTDIRLRPEVVRALGGLRGTVLTDWPDLLLREEPFTPDFIELGVLEGMRLDGRFDDRALLADIRAHKYSAIVLDPDLLSASYRGRAMIWPALRDAISGNYRAIPSLRPPYILMPSEARSSGRFSLRAASAALDSSR
jgi:hypothetical protein